jgi:hypothetical protein
MLEFRTPKLDVILAEIGLPQRGPPDELHYAQST